MKSKLLKDNVVMFTGNQEVCLIIQFLMDEMKPEHDWTVASLEKGLSDAVYDPLYWTSGTRCDLKNDWLVLTVPNIGGPNHRELRAKLKLLGFKWRNSLHIWSADYTEERASDEYRDELIKVLEPIKW